MKLSRRSFIFGGALSLVGSGLLLGGCSNIGSRRKVQLGEPIKVSLKDYFSSFDYVGTANPTLAAIGWHIFEGLYEINPVTNETYPALAKDWPKRVDSLTCEIEIRDDAKFSNGSLVLPGDVIYSINNAKQKDSINFMLNFIDRAEAVDKNKVRIYLNSPLLGNFEERLSLIKIIQSAASDTDKTSPVGTGPYAISEMDGQAGGLIKFIPNHYYNGSLEKPDNPMEWTVVPDADTRAAGVNQQIVNAVEEYPLSKVADKHDKTKVDFNEGFECALMFFNTSKEVFAKRENRQAALYAIDSDTLIKQCLDGHGYPVTSYLSKNNKNYSEASNIYDYSIDKARDLVNQSGVTNHKINVVFDKNCWAYDFKDCILKNLEDAGFQCSATDTSFRWTDIEEKLKRTDYDLCISTYERSFHAANADYLLNQLYYQNRYMQDITGYANLKDNQWSEIKKLIDEAANSESDSQQNIYKKVLDLVSQEVPAYPFVRKDQVTAYNTDSLEGFNSLSKGGLYLVGTKLVSD